MKSNTQKSFTTQLMRVFMIMLIIPSLFMTLLEYNYMKQSVTSKTDDYLKNLASVTMSKVEISVNSVEDIALYICSNDIIQLALTTDRTNLDSQSDYILYNRTQEILSYYTMLRKEILSVYIQSESGQVFRYSKNRQYLYDEELKKDNTADGNLWVVEDGKLFLIRTISKYPTGRSIGKMVLEIDSDEFYDIIKDIEYEGGSAFILDDKNTIVTENKETKEVEPSDYHTVEKEKKEGIYKEKINNQEYRIYLGESIENGWRMVLSIPTTYYEQDFRLMQNTFMLFLLLMCLITIPVAVKAAGKITRPLRSLSEAMNKVGQGVMEPVGHLEGDNEITLLGNTFDQMVFDMKRLIQENYEQKILKQAAEMKSLQMQINPHFLYNTLDTINWLARIEGNVEVGKITAALGNLMRYSLSPKEYVTVEEEITSLKNYINIQNTRYGDKVSVRFQVADACMLYYIPKLVIQPILENAIIHGVEDMIDHCHIQVRVFCRDEDLYAEVEDDGVGMTQESIQLLLSDCNQVEKKGHTSIGIMNANHRLRIAFGEDCGVSIQSILGSGTKVTLHMKCMESPPEKMEGQT